MAKRPSRAFFLYLRSFQGDHQTTEYWTLTTGDGRVNELYGATTKAALEALLEPAGPLIEIGGEQHLGLGQLKVDNAGWWQAALRQIIHASAIFLNPGETASFRKEVDLILSNLRLRRRAFLLMEPTHETMLSAGHEIDQIAARDRNARWTAAQTFFRAHHIDVPDYDPRGAIISLYSPELFKPLRGISRYGLYDLLQALYVDLRKYGSYDIEPDEACPCQSGQTFGTCHALQANLVSHAELQAARRAAQSSRNDAG